MKKIKRLAALLLAAALLSGCGGGKPDAPKGSNTGNEGQTETQPAELTWETVSNGDMIEREISEGVTLKARIQMPEEGLDGIQVLHVKQVGFSAEVYKEAFGIETPIEEWDYREGFGFEPEKVYNYTGMIDTGKETMQAILTLGTENFLSTERWFDKCAGNYPFSSYNNYPTPTEGMDTASDLPFMDKEEAIERGQEFFTETLGLEDVRILQAFSMRHEDMKKVQEDTIEQEKELGYNIKNPTSLDEWSEEDDAYYLIYEEIIHVLPLVSYPLPRNDDFYLNHGVVSLGITDRGIEMVQQGWTREVSEEWEEPLLSFEEVMKALEKKYSMTLTDGVELIGMKLVYYPYPTDIDPNAPYEYDLYPVWQFEYETQFGKELIYINAVDGIEIVG